MQLLFNSRDREAQDLRAWVFVRLRFALRRVAWRVSHASVQMTDIDGPRHGVDKRCQVSLKTAEGTPIVATAIARDWQAALNLALARATDVLKRCVARTRGRRAERRFIRAERQLGSSQNTA